MLFRSSRPTVQADVQRLVEIYRRNGRFDVRVDPKIIDVIRKNGALTGMDDKDATVIRLGRQLYTDKKVDSATFGKAVEYFGQRGVMDILAVMNTYAVSGFYAIAVDEHPPANRPALERTK